MCADFPVVPHSLERRTQEESGINKIHKKSKKGNTKVVSTRCILSEKFENNREINLTNEEGSQSKRNNINDNNHKYDVWQQQRRRRRNNLIYGKSTEDSTFKRVTKFVDFHIFRCPLDMTCEKMIEYLHSKNIIGIKCEKMQSKYPEVYCSFKVPVPANLQKNLIDPEVWPEYVGVDRFRSHFLEKKSQNNDATP